MYRATPDLFLRRTAMPLDLDAYLARIDYAGPCAVDLATLRRIHELHPRAIPFESIDPWLGRPVPLDIEALQDKLVTRRRGGYCFEHNLLLLAVLERIGFDVRGLAARVVYSTPPGGGRHPRNHMLLLIGLGEQHFIADVGFGGLTMTSPLRLEAGVIQETPHERFRLSRAGHDYELEAEAGDTWRAMYQFGLEQQIDADYEMANWFTSTYPGCAFVMRLIAARTLPGKRLALANNAMSIHHTGSPSERRTITDADELRRVLEGDFNIVLPDDPHLDEKLRGLIEAAS
jgi:N-hydroxyarylamine O-acetyltransferase